MEPPRGFEPRTPALRKRCSTVELRWLRGSRGLYRQRAAGINAFCAAMAGNSGSWPRPLAREPTTPVAAADSTWRGAAATCGGSPVGARLDDLPIQTGRDNLTRGVKVTGLSGRYSLLRNRSCSPVPYVQQPLRQGGTSVARVRESRRHDRAPLSCPVALLDTSGKVLLRGQACDVSPQGIRVSGERRLDMRAGQACWVELSVPSPYKSGPRRRIVKLMGDIRRCSAVGEGKSVTAIVVFRSNFSPDLLSPVG